MNSEKNISQESPLDRAIFGFLPEREHLFISVSGSGGKTSLLQLLGQFYKNLGCSVLLTTTTKVQSPLYYKWRVNRVITNAREALFCIGKKGTVTLCAEKSSNERKLQAPDLEILKKLKNKYDVVISEADGSRNLPMKIHTERDPVIPSYSDYTICVLGSWGIGHACKEVVFGYKEREINIYDGELKTGRNSVEADSDNQEKPKTGRPGIANAGTDYVFREFLQSEIVDSPQGLLKGTKKRKRLVVLNEFETLTFSQKRIYKELRFPADVIVLGGSVKENTVFERIK